MLPRQKLSFTILRCGGSTAYLTTLGKLTLHPMVSHRYIHNTSKGPTLVHCPNCRGILAKTLNPKHCGIKQPFILFMRCPHCLKDVKMEMVEGSEEKILIEVLDAANHKTS